MKIYTSQWKKSSMQKFIVGELTLRCVQKMRKHFAHKAVPKENKHKKLTFVVVYHVVQGPDHEYGKTGLQQVKAFFLPRSSTVCISKCNDELE